MSSLSQFGSLFQLELELRLFTFSAVHGQPRVGYWDPD